MERRYLLFIVLSCLIFMLNLLLMRAMAPQRQVAQQKQGQAANEAAKKPDKPPADKPDKQPEKPPEDDVKAAEAEKEPAEKEQPAEKEAAAVAVPQQWITLGSADPASPYRMLVTLTNQGAAVVRVELNSPRYRDLEDRSGYLGHLAPADAPQHGGAQVQVVGQGTPADLAGIKVGDVIQAVDQRKVAGAADLILALKETKPKQQVTLSVDRAGRKVSLTAQLRRRPLEVMHAEKDTEILDFPQPGQDPLSLLLTMQQVGAAELGEKDVELKGLTLRTGNWEVLKAGENEAGFRMKLPKQHLEITKRFRLSKVPPDTDDASYPAYHLEYTVEIHNTSPKAQTVAYRQDGPTGLPIEGAWYASKIERASGVGLRDLVAQLEDGKPPYQMTTSVIVADDKAKWLGAGVPLKYVAVDAQYFSAALIPKKAAKDVWFSDILPIRVGAVPKDPNLKKLTNVSFRLVSQGVELKPDQSLKHEYQFFVGPKKPDLLASYPTEEFNSRSPGTLSGLVYYGWFGWVAEPMLAVLHAFYAVVRNYGLAIIMLTVLVRGCMFPLSRKQALSAQKMQELQPEIKRINEKYKKNPQQKTQAQQELFRKHNYNPLGGCLLMFVQLPIFIGLYRSLMVDVELRQAPLITDAIRWASNLAAPDMLFDWSPWMPEFITKGTGFLWLGPYFNILPLATVGLFLWQQKMFMPPPADDNARTQQKMMQYMMIFMAIMFYKVASGLCIYFIASSLWGIAERKILPKAKPPQPGGDLAAARPPRVKPGATAIPVPARRSSVSAISGARGSALFACLGATMLRFRRPTFMVHLDDTICAIASAPGGARRAVVRLSGPGVLATIETCFRPQPPARLADVTRPTVVAGSISLPPWGEGAARDSLPADLYFWPTDRSYTREPAAEIHTLGSPPLVAAVLQALSAAGARLAQPGEFTLRAFLAGRLDLTQAEAVLGLIDAAGDRQCQVALAQLAGGLARPLSELRESLLDLLAQLEAGLDFVEEDIEFIGQAELHERLSEAGRTVAGLTARMSDRSDVSDAVRAVLVGWPNVGKSSLFNALSGGALSHASGSRSGGSAALVSDEPGTTRDYLVAWLDPASPGASPRCQLIDTAGVEPGRTQRLWRWPRKPCAAVDQRGDRSGRRAALVPRFDASAQPVGTSGARRARDARAADRAHEVRRAPRPGAA